MLEKVLAAGEYENYRYRLLACHIPVVYVDKHGYFEPFRNEWTVLLNEMDMDIGLSGHKHVMWPLIPGQVEPKTTLMYSEDYIGVAGKKEGGYLIDFNFPNFLVGRRSLELADNAKTGPGMYVCLATQVDLAAGQQTGYYVNSEREIPSGYYPFGNGQFTEIVTKIKRPQN